MPTYEILVRGKAAKQIKQLPVEYFRQVSQHIRRLAEEPRPPVSKRFKGNLGYTLRVGVYRILYDVDDEARTVTTFRVKHRRDVYRGL